MNRILRHLSLATVLASGIAGAQSEPDPPLWEMLGAAVPAGEIRRLAWRTDLGVGLIDDPTPVLVAHGNQPGPVLCMTAAIHGDELNGIEIIRRVFKTLDPTELSGTVIGVPIVNLPGFQRGSRYLPDRRDLNRAFPGNPTGSLAKRVAYDFFETIVKRCDTLVDLHTGSFYRTNLPQLRADLSHPDVVAMTKGFGAIAVLDGKGAHGTLRRAATEAGIAAVTMEVGEPLRLQSDKVATAVKGIESLMAHLEMRPARFLWRKQQPVFYESRWVRIDRGGILLSAVELGQDVKAGQVLGTVADPLRDVSSDILAPYAGRVLGMAVDQFVMPGFAAYRLGIETDEAELPAEDTAAEPPGTDPSEDDPDGN